MEANGKVFGMGVGTHGREYRSCGKNKMQSEVRPDHSWIEY